MSTYVQTPVVLSPGGFGTNHDYAFACSAGNTLVCQLRDYSDITAVTLLGASGDLDPGYVDGTNLSYSFKGLPSGVTGFRVTTSGAHTDTQALVYEAAGEVEWDTPDGGATMPGDFTEFVTATLVTTKADALVTALWPSLGDTLTDDAGYDHSAEVDAWMAQFNDTPVGAAGSKTIGGEFSAQNSRSGYAVAYVDAAPPPVVPPTYDNAPRFDLQRVDDDEDLASALTDARSWF